MTTPNYNANKIEIHYRNKTFKADYLNWYKEQMRHPNCPIQAPWQINFNNIFESSICCYSIANSTFSNYSKTIQLYLDANIHMRKVLVLIPRTTNLVTLQRYFGTRTVIDTITISEYLPVKRLRTRQIFHLSHVDHVEIFNGNEIAFLFSPKSVIFEEVSYNENGTQRGKDVHELHFDTGQFGFTNYGNSGGFF